MIGARRQHLVLPLFSGYFSISSVMEVNAFQQEKLSIKNLLFTKAIPNYTLPVPTDGRPIFSCTDCGDKFIIKSSYEYHIKRKSLKITYFCRHCNIGLIFFNRCDLLSHIRSHAFKTATISISDLKIEPLPLSYYNYPNQTNFETEAPSFPVSSLKLSDGTETQDDTQTFICFDCKQNVFSSGITHKDRAKHYTQYKNILFSCPICLLTLTTKCALEAHLRIHIRKPPYYCSDCGMFLTEKTIVYPYTHDCESFRMMRATAKLKCRANNCNKIFHPSESIKHLRTNHLKSVFKCPLCSVACYKLDNMQKHLNSFHSEKLKNTDSKKLKHIDFLQCEMCPGRLIIPGQIERHLKGHEMNYINSVYPCWTCGATFKAAKSLLKHQEFVHPEIYKEKILGKTSQETNAMIAQNLKTSQIRRSVSEKCDKCFKNVVSKSRTFLCKCKADSPKMVCNLCHVTIPQDWAVIKKHYAIYHKEHVCLDAKILVKKMRIHQNKRKIIGPKKRKMLNHEGNIPGSVKNIYCAPENSNNLKMSIHNYTFVCSKCGQGYQNKQNLEKHIIEHRDPFMAYQCMECGESFIAKPSFSTHLLLKHGINDVNTYIDEKKCYSEESLHTQKPVNIEQNEPVKENQCNICREQFCNSTDFEKHFRVHGMAFLLKTTNKPSSPEKLEK